MFIAKFKTKEDLGNFNVKITFGEYIQSKINQDSFLSDLSFKFKKNFYNMYYGGTSYHG